MEIGSDAIDAALKGMAQKFGCRKCSTVMQRITVRDMLFGTTVYYCDNATCDLYGFLTIVGVPLSSNPPKK